MTQHGNMSIKKPFDIGLKGKLPAFICIVFSQKENPLLESSQPYQTFSNKTWEFPGKHPVCFIA